MIWNYVLISTLTSFDGERGPSSSSCAPPARERGAEADRQPSSHHGVSLSLPPSRPSCGSAICDTLGDTLGVHGAVAARAKRFFRRQLARINPVPPPPPAQQKPFYLPLSPHLSLSLPCKRSTVSLRRRRQQQHLGGWRQGKWMLLTEGSLGSGGGRR